MALRRTHFIETGRTGTSLPEVAFDNPRLRPVGVEVLTISALRSKAPRPLIAVPQRVDFHHLILVERGGLRHTIDLVDHELQPGSVALVRPGQIQHWDIESQAEGYVVLISPEALAPALARPEPELGLITSAEWPAVAELPADERDAIVAGVVRMQRELDRFTPCKLAAAIIRQELTLLLLQLTRDIRPLAPGTGAGSGDAEIFRLFREVLERHFMERWSVVDFARRIGYSGSTLSRACQSAVGQSAKQVIDARVALEAKRLLTHSPMHVACVGRQLGFTEPTNFIKFFRRVTGLTPQEFRDRTRLAR